MKLIALHFVDVSLFRAHVDPRVLDTRSNRLGHIIFAGIEAVMTLAAVTARLRLYERRTLA